jgi:putative ABC transport system permease protein
LRISELRKSAIRNPCLPSAFRQAKSEIQENPMFKNYLKIALRNILKHKVYSLINIFGLAIGMACSILILLWVRDELSYDRFHQNADRIYRVTREWKNRDGETSLHLARVAPPIGPLLKNDFPNIVEDVVRRCGEDPFRF